MIRIGIIGYGYWGPNLARNFSDLSSGRLGAICDMRPERLEMARRRHPEALVTSDYQKLIHNPHLDAVAIATPLATHFKIALAALRAGKHVLVEKPMAGSSAEARQLIREAKKRRLILMVDHTYVYTPAVQYIKKLIESGRLGRLYYYDSVRVNLGLFQSDVNVLWDLAVHDLAIMDYVLGLRPHAVSAVGNAHVPGHPENIAYMTCFFKNNFIAHFHVNWLAPVKVRYALIGGERRMAIYNDLEGSEKVKIYDKGVQVKPRTEKFYESLVNYRVGNMWAPKLDQTEALRTEAEHFVTCIRTKCVPITDGEAGLRVLKILEAANKSMKRNGTQVKLG